MLAASQRYVPVAEPAGRHIYNIWKYRTGRDREESTSPSSMAYVRSPLSDMGLSRTKGLL